MGIDMTMDINTKCTQLFDNIFQRLKALAPITLRIPISLVRCCATNEVNPYSPREEIKIASTANNDVSVPTCTSLTNFFSYSTSRNLKSNGTAGSTERKTFSIRASASCALSIGFNRMLYHTILYQAFPS